MPKKTTRVTEFSAPLWLNKNRKAFLQSRRIDLLEKIDEHGSITQAAKAAGMSYKGAWDAVNSMNNLADKPLTVNMAGGRSGGGTFLTEEGRSLIQMFRMVEAEHSHALGNIGKNADDLERALNLMRRISMRISAKNVCYGTVCEIRRDNLLAEVCIALKSGHQVSSVITAESVETLCLVVGEAAYAVIKASSVLISSDVEGLRISASNLLRGQVVSIRADRVMAEVVLDIGGGDTIAATITAGGANNLGVSEGDEACAVIDASNVIIGVE